jgi:hypothetical protein
MQAGVEPLRRIRRHHLHRQHEAVLVEERLRVGFGRKIAALPAPIGPGAGQPIEHLLGRLFAGEAFGLGQFRERRFVGNAAPQPRGDRLLLDLFAAGGDAGFAEIFLRQHIGGDLRPLLRHFNVFGMEDDGTVRIADLARRETERDAGVWRLSLFGVAPLDPHSLPPVSCVSRFDGPAGFTR